MNNIEYRSFMVGNITLRKNIPLKGFDLYCLKNEVPKVPSPSASYTKGFTDVIFSNWAQGDQGARQFLLNPFAHNKYRDFLLTDLQNYYPALRISQADIGAVRMTLWGHSVPVCQAGQASSQELAMASRPIGNIFFANQDNLVSPAYESSESTALEAATQILKKGARS